MYSEMDSLPGALSAPGVLYNTVLCDALTTSDLVFGAVALV